MRVVGLGTQDSLEDAADFVDQTGTASLLMTWDASFETWSYYGVSSQPQAILLSAEGEPIASWAGRLSIDEVLDAIENL
ncbi:MAG: hypothetical protein O3C27_04375 [Actinomycetota bacterium]|nr:hypothetical protein [Actinomycetota bacterium]